MTLAVLEKLDLPDLPGRVLSARELRAWVRELAGRPELWERYVHHEGSESGGRHYVSLYRDADIDVGLGFLAESATVVEPSLDAFCQRLLVGLAGTDQPADDIAVVALRRS